MRRTRTERLAFPTFVILPPPLDEDDRDKDDPDEDYHDNDKIGYAARMLIMTRVIMMTVLVMIMMMGMMVIIVLMIILLVMTLPAMIVHKRWSFTATSAKLPSRFFQT